MAGVQLLERRVHGAERDAIARAAASLPVGGLGYRLVSHDIPIENDEHGEVTVVREFAPDLPAGGGPTFDCKEIIFSVDRVAHHQEQRSFYTTYVCRDNNVWKWALAEPATARRGGLQ